MKTGVITESFRTDFFEALKKARSCGAQGVQIYANGQVVNTEMTKSMKEKVKAAVKDEGLEISALCADMGSKLFYYPQKHADLVEKQRQVIDLALDLGCNIVTGHIGVVESDKNSWQYKTLQDTYGQLAVYAASKGAYYAVETGPETAQVLKEFLDGIKSRGAAVNFDPANLVMCAGDVPEQAVRILKDYIVHTHAKDGVMLKKTDTRQIYANEIYNLPKLEEEVFSEVPLGEGSVNFGAYISALEEIGYKGYLTVEREVGADPYADIAHAVKFLNKYTRGASWITK